ncbi:MAG: hypothetical protein ACJ74U_15355 [Jatrophihabitantaceae bacterium]
MGKPATPAKAAYSLRQHSCERHRRLREAHARGAAARAAVDRAPKPCRHKNARHVHGDYSCYVADECRCWPCTLANAAYESRRTRLKAYGRWQPFVPAAPAAAHVRELMAAGLGLRRISELSGVAHGALWRLIYGKRGPDGLQRPSTRLRPQTAQRLLTLQPEQATPAGGTLVDATGTRRRLQALVAIGWPLPILAVQLDMTASNSAALLQRARVTRSTADKAAALYDRLWDSSPLQASPEDTAAVAAAQAHAQKHGWAPPMAWDDETIDDPTAEPDLGERVRRSKLPPAEELRFLLDAGESEDMIASRFGVKLSAVRRALQRDRAEQAEGQERHVDGDAEAAA